MTNNNPASGNAPGLSKQKISMILEASDMVASAIDLIECIEMTQRYIPEDESSALATVAFMARSKMKEAKALLKAVTTANEVTL